MLRKIISVTLSCVILFSVSIINSYPWGFYAHKKINRMAVFTIPSDLIGFYKRNIEFITDHAIDPDSRRNVTEGEAERHYIDIDHYGPDPFSAVPKQWDDAVKKFTEDTLKAYGIVPWHIQIVTYRLTKAFKEENFDRILQLSADLGHYIGDAHVPLHTTENYNGQLTNQRGIHGFWESRIPELKAEDYDFMVGRAKYIEHPLDKAWDAVKASHAALDSVLLFEAELNKKFPSDVKYSYEARGNTNVKTYSIEYTEAYNKMLNGMVERRMREAIITTGSFWYTAWVNAGKPDLNKYENKTVSEELLKEIQEIETKANEKKISETDREN